MAKTWPLLLGFCLGSMAWNVCWPFLPLRVQAVGVADLGEVARLSGLLAGGTNLVTAILGPLWTTVAERFGFRLQVIRAHLGTGLAMGAFGLARSPLELIGAGALLGTLGGNYPHYMALAAGRAATHDVGRVVGDMQAAGQIGATIGPLIGGALASQLGLTAAFVASTAIAWGAAMMISATVEPDRGLSATSRGGGSMRAAMRNSGQRWLMALLLVGDIGYQGVRPLIPVLITARVADQATVAATTGIAATLATGAGVAAALLVGRVARIVSPRRILVVTLPLGALFLALIPLTTDVPMLLIVLTLGGLVSGAMTPCAFAWLGRLNPGSGGFALMASGSMFVFALGPAIMGQISVYGLDWPFRVAAALAAIAVILVVVVGGRVSPPRSIQLQPAP